jgi:hypothetical protein
MSSMRPRTQLHTWNLAQMRTSHFTSSSTFCRDTLSLSIPQIAGELLQRQIAFVDAKAYSPLIGCNSECEFSGKAWALSSTQCEHPNPPQCGCDAEDPHKARPSLLLWNIPSSEQGCLPIARSYIRVRLLRDSFTSPNLASSYGGISAGIRPPSWKATTISAQPAHHTSDIFASKRGTLYFPRTGKLSYQASPWATHPNTNLLTGRCFVTYRISQAPSLPS